MIKDFCFFAPTRIIFGRESEERLTEMLAAYGARKVLVHYGGSSALKSGLLEKTLSRLDADGFEHVELGGVVPNPLLSKVEEGIRICREENVDFILAIGGGSVIDSAKAIAYGTCYDGDPWDFWDGKAVPEMCLPIGVVLTIPAAGSEMSSSCVITRDEGLLKRGINSDLCRPRFAIMNPERTFTLPPYQTAAGATDIMMHTMERYFSKYEDMTLTDSISEALLRTVKDCVAKALSDPEDYRSRAQIMWAGSLAHNDLTECGTEKDFATHRLEHELSALFGVTHGAGLAALWPSWARFVMPRHTARFARFATNVMGVAPDFAHLSQTAEEGIRAMERFYQSIGMPTNIPQLLGRKATEEEILLMAEKCSRGETITVGALETIAKPEMIEIYRMANE